MLQFENFGCFCLYRHPNFIRSTICNMSYILCIKQQWRFRFKVLQGDKAINDASRQVTNCSDFLWAGPIGFSMYMLQCKHMLLFADKGRFSKAGWGWNIKTAVSFGYGYSMRLRLFVSAIHGDQEPMSCLVLLTNMALVGEKTSWPDGRQEFWRTTRLRHPPGTLLWKRQRSTSPGIGNI